MPEHIRLLLSDREYRVLIGTLERKNFREIASELSISESTVKTYMRRIYEKMGVKGKKELLQMLSHL
jgi:DNA-binding CsgD family transcriptional regulator